LITSEQIKAARAMLKITTAQLSEISGVGVATIKRMEASSGVPSTHTKTLQKVANALIDSGIEFIGTPDSGPGVRLIKT